MGDFANFIAFMLGADLASHKLLDRYEEGDFIPNGDFESLENINFRHAGGFDLYQCCQQISEDMQSGPIYCGRLATIVVGTRKRYIGLCKKCAKRPNKRLRWVTPEAKDSLYGK